MKRLAVHQGPPLNPEPYFFAVRLRWSGQFIVFVGFRVQGPQDHEPTRFVAKGGGRVAHQPALSRAGAIRTE